MSAGFSSSSHHHLMDKENAFDEDATGLTRRFSRSVSLQTRVYSPETTLSWPDHPHAPSPPPFVKTDEDAWNQIYAATGQVARMKMSIINGDGGVIGGSPWRRSGGEEILRRQHVCRSRCVSAWPPSQLQNPCHQQNNPNQHNLVVLGGGCDGGGAATAKRGTGVFLPRRYCSIPPESGKRQACPPANLPPQVQPSINTSFLSHYETLMSRRKAMISSGQQRLSNIHGGVMESAVNNPEVLLPQEWTY